MCYLMCDVGLGSGLLDSNEPSSFLDGGRFRNDDACGHEMLDDELQLAAVVVRHSTAVALDPGLGNDPAPDDVRGLSGVYLNHAVAACRGIPEERVALHPDDAVEVTSEGLLTRAVHPYNGVLGVVDDYDVVHEVEDHVHELLRIDILLVPRHE